jgi:hypothetical protein
MESPMMNNERKEGFRVVKRQWRLLCRGEVYSGCSLGVMCGCGRKESIEHKDDVDVNFCKRSA